MDRPVLKVRGESLSSDFLSAKDFYNLLVKFQYEGAIFDRLFFTDPFINETAIIALAEALKGVLTPPDKNVLIQEDLIDKDDDDEEFEFESPIAEGYKVVISQKIPVHGQRISEIVKKQILTTELANTYKPILEKMESAEQEFFGDRDNPLFTWDGVFIANVFRKQGFTVKLINQEIIEKRRITKDEIKKWFNVESSAYGSKILEALGSADTQKIINLLETSSDNTIFSWKNEIAYLIISK